MFPMDYTKVSRRFNNTYNFYFIGNGRVLTFQCMYYDFSKSSYCNFNINIFHFDQSLISE